MHSFRRDLRCGAPALGAALQATLQAAALPLFGVHVQIVALGSVGCQVRRCRWIYLDSRSRYGITGLVHMNKHGYHLFFFGAITGLVHMNKPGYSIT